MDKIVNSIKEVDFSDFKMPIIAVYQNPEDYPGKCVARIFDLDEPTSVVIVKDALGLIQNDIRINTGMYFVKRGEDDVKSLVGVWM